MPSKSIHSYGDVQPVLEKAMQEESLTYRLSSVGQAMNFRHRCYRFMKMRRELLAEQMGEIPGIAPPDPYAGLVIGLRHPVTKAAVKGKKDCEGACDVFFSHRTVTGELFDSDGNPISLSESTDGLDLD